ncbi:Crossover junction endonuclease MUS81 [Orchesella cincta]|uniref:Crossover junction endonuclease MUS81 n=1 Tax=Orchesella cincta TaxID=48709 RepID=A0A1D2MC21_ORCCI|nr:Crossover junction endonuclease MUS81 [Orchesella cincta]
MEWKDEAEVKDSKMKYVYAKALSSLRKYPLSLSRGKDCSVLENFGAHMCKMIENRMVKENMMFSTPDEEEEDEEPRPSNKKAGAATKKKMKPPSAADPQFDSSEPQSLSSTSSQPTKAKQKQYLPVFRSGAYAILLALLDKDNQSGYRGFMTKSELQQEAQIYCDASMTKPDSQKNSHYTAWNSMKLLITKELVVRRGGNPVQFYLTIEGRNLARKLQQDVNSQSQNSRGGGRGGSSQSSQQSRGGGDGSNQSQSQDVVMSSEVDEDSEVVATSNVCLEPGKFEIVLYVDTCETNGRSKSQDVINELQKNGVTIYVHRLSVGDFVWVCREISSNLQSQKRLTISRTNELVLPYVVERKRMDDLAHSIRDGRFHEQKHRLTQTKLQPIYLIERFGSRDDNWMLGEGALDRAICNTQIENGFLVQETSSIKETCAYLTFMTRHLKKMYEQKSVIGCRKTQWQNKKDGGSDKEAFLMFFSDFNDSSVKKMNFKIKEMFARQLMRLKGLSVDKAYAIIQKYPTVDHLLNAYSECETDKQKEKLLANISFGLGGRKIGPSISSKVSRLYNSTSLS